MASEKNWEKGQSAKGKNIFQKEEHFSGTGMFKNLEKCKDLSMDNVTLEARKDTLQETP